MFSCFSFLLQLLTLLPRLVSGNTGTGVFKDDGPYDMFINLNKVKELHETTTDPEVVFGGNVTITSAIHTLEASQVQAHLGVAHHLKKIASHGIRNQGSLAGNLMLKHQHKDFPSDVFVSFEGIGAILEVMTSSGEIRELSLLEFLDTTMDKSIIVKIKLPSLTSVNKRRNLQSLWSSSKTAKAMDWKFISFKIMPRSSNAHAYVNAAFLALVDSSDNFKIIEKPRLVFGGISGEFVHAKATEEFLIGRAMNSHDTFLEALAILAEEIVPNENPVLTSTLYRKQVALCLFYKVKNIQVSLLSIF